MQSNQALRPPWRLDAFLAASKALALTSQQHDAVYSALREEPPANFSIEVEAAAVLASLASGGRDSSSSVQRRIVYVTTGHDRSISNSRCTIDAPEQVRQTRRRSVS
jgi:hypothetical protein